MDDPWGADEPPVPVPDPPPALPDWLATLAELSALGPVTDAGWPWPQPSHLPEVAELEEQGWCSTPDYLQSWVLLPAVWPRGHRCWVPDRLPHPVVTAAPGSPFRDEMLRALARREDESAQEQRQRAGLPEPPAGRLWLLRSPWPGTTVPEVVALLESRCEQLGIDAGPANLARVGRDVLTWSEEQVQSYVPDPVVLFVDPVVPGTPVDLLPRRCRDVLEETGVADLVVRARVDRGPMTAVLAESATDVVVAVVTPGGSGSGCWERRPLPARPERTTAERVLVHTDRGCSGSWATVRCVTAQDAVSVIATTTAGEDTFAVDSGGVAFVVVEEVTLLGRPTLTVTTRDGERFTHAWPWGH